MEPFSNEQLRKDTFDRAIRRVNSEDQMDKCIEEMSELIKAILKTRQFGCVFSHSVLEELTHVRLSLDLLEYWIPSNAEILEHMYRTPYGKVE